MEKEGQLLGKINWEGVVSSLYLRVHAEYIPLVVIVANRFGFPVMVYERNREEVWQRITFPNSRTIGVDVGDPDKINRMDEEEFKRFFYELRFVVNYPG